MRLLFDIFGQTLQTLWGHKLRSFLTMFGIAWGVFSLLLLVGLGEGFRSGNKKQFDTLGENVMFLWSGRAPAVQGSFTALRQYYLTYRDYLDILRECRSVGAASPVIKRNDIRAVSDYYQASGQILGVPAAFDQIRYLLAGGDPAEVAKAKIALRSAAIGYGLAVLAPVIVIILSSLTGGPH